MYISNLYTQWGVQTSNPEITSRTLFWLMQPGGLQSLHFHYSSVISDLSLQTEKSLEHPVYMCLLILFLGLSQIFPVQSWHFMASAKLLSLDCTLAIQENPYEI